MRVWRSKRRPGEMDRPAAWVRRIALNEALRVVEHRWRDEPVEPEALQDLRAPDRHDASLPEGIELTDLMGTLSPPDRTLIWLRYVEDLTQARVARRLGIPEGTVKVRLHRVRERVRRVMEAS
jgi:RNA polymerase sigma-70 factor, ECF subfamily